MCADHAGAGDPAPDLATGKRSRCVADEVGLRAGGARAQADPSPIFDLGRSRESDVANHSVVQGLVEKAEARSCS